MSEDFKRLSDAVVSAREARGWSERDLAYACGLARATIRGLEAGNHRMMEHTHKQVERAFGWAPGSMDAILQGGDPTTDLSNTQPLRDQTGQDATETTCPPSGAAPSDH